MSESLTKDSPLVWMDLEMTGLYPDTDEIIEIAVVITDQNLNVIASGPDLVIKQEPERFARMDQWNQEQHTKTGLWQAALDSKITLAEAEEQVLSFVKQHCPKGKSPLCGNTVWQDRRFLFRYMQNLEAYLHYRIIDVSTVKELAQRWAPKIANGFVKKNNHRALDDILESIEELKYYRTHFFKVAQEL